MQTAVKAEEPRHTPLLAALLACVAFLVAQVLWIGIPGVGVFVFGFFAIPSIASCLDGLIRSDAKKARYWGLITVLPLTSILAEFGVFAIERVVAESGMEEVVAAVEAYRDQNDGLPPDSLEQLIPDYLQAIESCGFAGRAARYTYAITDGVPWVRCYSASVDISHGFEPLPQTSSPEERPR